MTNFTTRTIVAAAVLALTGCASKQPNANLDAARATYERVSSNQTVIDYSTEDLNVASLKLEAAITAWEDKKSKAEVDKSAYIAEQYALIAEQRSNRQKNQRSVSDGKLARTNVQMELRASEALAARTQAELLTEQSAELEQQVKQREQRLQQQLAELEELKQLQARNSNRGMVLTLGDVLFDTGESTLKPGAQSNLLKVATFLQKYPNRKLNIEGHTDNTGDEEFNMNLSAERAVAVKSLLASYGVELSLISAQGLGESTPIASNDSAAGRQRNRRVDLIFTDSDETVISTIDE